MSPPYRAAASPPPTPLPAGARFGCLFAFLAFAVVVAAIGFAIAHPRPGVVVVFAALLVAWPLAARAARIAEINEQLELARLRAVAPPVGDAWRKLLAARGLGPFIDDIAPHVRPAVRLVLTRADYDASLGSSHAGDDPFLPPGFEWPRRGGLPMGFVLQIDLADVRRARADLTLPTEGTLYVFEPTDGSFEWCVTVAPPGERVSTPAPATDAPRGSSRADCHITFEAYDDLPDSDLVGTITTAWDDELRRDYEEIREYLAGNGRALHKLLGHPNAVQDVREVEGDGSSRVLLQLDTDEVTGWMWGDAGRIYCTVNRSALEAGDLSRVETNGQSG